MLPQRQTRRSASRVFLISGIPETEREELRQMIQKLGAVYLKTDVFTNNATHVVCRKLTRSEKFLGAVALGRWVVKPEYIGDSFRAKKWLDEADYEWSEDNTQLSSLLAAAAQRGRRRAEMSKEKIFAGWQVAVVLGDHKRQNVYKRLLAYGGAKIFALKLPATNPEAESEKLTYLFTDPSKAQLACDLQKCGVMCLNVDFLSDFLILDPPPDPLNYALLSLDGTPSTPALARSSCDLPKGLSRVASLQKQHETLSFSQLGSCVTASQCDKSATVSPLTVPASQCDRSATVSPLEASNYHLSQSSPCLVALTNIVIPPSFIATATSSVAAITKRFLQKDYMRISYQKKKNQESKMGTEIVQSMGSLTTTPVLASQRSILEWFRPQDKENDIAKGVHCLDRQTTRQLSKNIDVDPAQVMNSRTEKNLKHAGRVDRQLHEVPKKKIKLEACFSPPVKVTTFLKKKTVSTDQENHNSRRCSSEVEGVSTWELVQPTYVELMTKSVKHLDKLSQNDKTKPVSEEESHKSGAEPVVHMAERKDTKVRGKPVEMPSARVLQAHHASFHQLSGVIQNQKRRSIPTQRMTLFMSAVQSKKKRNGCGAKEWSSKSIFCRDVPEKSVIAHQQEQCQQGLQGDSKVTESCPKAADGLHLSQMVSESRTRQKVKLKGEFYQEHSDLVASRSNRHEELKDKSHVKQADLRSDDKVNEKSCVNIQVDNVLLGSQDGLTTSTAHKSPDIVHCTDNASEKFLPVELPQETSKIENFSQRSMFTEMSGTAKLRSSLSSSDSINKNISSVRKRVLTSRMAGFMQNLQVRKVFKEVMHEVEKPDSDLTVQAALARGVENERVIQSCTLHCESQNLDLPVDKNDFLKVSANGPMDVVNTNGPNDMVSINKHGDLKSSNTKITMCSGCSDLKDSFTASVPLASSLRPVEDRVLQTAACGASSQFARGGAAICDKNRWHRSSQQIFVRPRWHFLHSPIEGVVLMNDRAKWSLKDPVPQRTLTSLNFLLTSSFEEGCYNTTIATAHLLTSQCPSEQMIRCLVSILKEAKEESTVNAAYSLLMTWLKQHPPIDSNIRNVYDKGLKLYDWDSVQETIELSVDTAAGETDHLLPSWSGARLHLKFLLATLECNFLHFLHNINKQGACNCLVIRCFWAPSYQICCNTRIQRLLTFLERSLKAFNSAQACWEEILGLLAMAAQCCHLADNNWQWGEAMFSTGESTAYFVQELAASVSACDRQILQLVLSRIPVPWLRGQLSAALLSNYDDYLVPGGLRSDQWSLARIPQDSDSACRVPLGYISFTTQAACLLVQFVAYHLPGTFNYIEWMKDIVRTAKVSQFFYLLPNLSHTSDSQFTRKKTAETDIVDPDVPTSLAGQRLTANKINKRNPKGETLLHRAAIKNDVVLLKQMLSVPGVDVNAQDNAGWSPLHEACHHGNVECVRALLKFVPKKTIDTFTHGAGKLKRVDIRALSEEKITPLHDAVLKNHINVVTLLLQYGGTSLLQARTVLGNTPLDLARTEEMRQVLTSATSVDTKLSQDLLYHQSSCREHLPPSSFLYSQVLGEADVTVTASAEDCAQFLDLLVNVLSSDLQMKRLQQPGGNSQQFQHSLLLTQHQEAAAGQGKPCGVADSVIRARKKAEFHSQCLCRHLHKITTPDVFQGLRFQLVLVDELLKECFLYENHTGMLR